MNVNRESETEYPGITYLFTSIVLIHVRLFQYLKLLYWQALNMICKVWCIFWQVVHSETE